MSAHSGEFRELPGRPPDIDARRQAFAAVMRRLAAATPPSPDETIQTALDDGVGRLTEVAAGAGCTLIEIPNRDEP